MGKERRNLRTHVERFIQTMKVECLDKFVMWAERHLNYVSQQFEAWYNTARLHEARRHLPPTSEGKSEERQAIGRGEVVCDTRLGGLLKSYSRRAALQSACGSDRNCLRSVSVRADIFRRAVKLQNAVFTRLRTTLTDVPELVVSPN